MRVFRVERISDGKGPFGTGPYGLATGLDDMAVEIVVNWRYAYIGDGHPCPYNDEISTEMYDFRYKHLEPIFGCPDIHMIWYWFGPIIPYLEQMGYWLVEFDVPDEFAKVSKSRKQVVFARNKATVIQQGIKP